MKMTTRDKWMASLMPALLAGGGYLYLVKGGLEKELTDQNSRLEAAKAPPSRPASAGAGTLEQTKAALKAAREEEAACGKRLAALRTAWQAVDPAAAPADKADPVAVVGRIERVLKRHGLAPLLSADGAGTELTSLAGAMTALSGAAPGTAAGQSAAPVWHLVVDGTAEKFRAAMADLASEVPSAVPLGLNLAYNPDTGNETRLLELWLLY